MVPWSIACSKLVAVAVWLHWEQSAPSLLEAPKCLIGTHTVAPITRLCRTLKKFMHKFLQIFCRTYLWKKCAKSLKNFLQNNCRENHAENYAEFDLIYNSYFCILGRK